MPLSDADRRALYDRIGGRCECEVQHDGVEAPHHGSRCPSLFTFASGSGTTDWWEPVFKPGEAESLETARAYCGACYKLATA
jgi:hypothetical protein